MSRATAETTTSSRLCRVRTSGVRRSRGCSRRRTLLCGVTLSRSLEGLAVPCSVLADALGFGRGRLVGWTVRAVRGRRWREVCDRWPTLGGLRRVFGHAIDKAEDELSISTMQLNWVHIDGQDHRAGGDTDTCAVTRACEIRSRYRIRAGGLSRSSPPRRRLART